MVALWTKYYECIDSHYLDSWDLLCASVCQLPAPGDIRASHVLNIKDLQRLQIYHVVEWPDYLLHNIWFIFCNMSNSAINWQCYLDEKHEWVPGISCVLVSLYNQHQVISGLHTLLDNQYQMITMLYMLQDNQWVFTIQLEMCHLKITKLISDVGWMWKSILHA